MNHVMSCYRGHAKWLKGDQFAPENNSNRLRKLLYYWN